MRERFQATCLGSDPEQQAAFATWSFSLKSLRWEAIEEFSTELLKLEGPLRHFWNKNKFMGGMKGSKHKAWFQPLWGLRRRIRGGNR